MGFNSAFKGLNAELNPVCHLPALLGAQPILHVSRMRVKQLSLLKLMYRGALIRSGLGDEKKIPCHYQESNANRPSCKEKLKYPRQCTRIQLPSTI